MKKTIFIIGSVLILLTGCGSTTKAPVVPKSVKNGVHTEYFRHGGVRSKVNYVNGKMHGIYKAWYYNGHRAMQVRYINGKKDGLEKSWFDDGKVQDTTPWVNGKQHGTYIHYYPDGKIHETHQLVNGSRVGVQKLYAESGKLENAQYCINGECRQKKFTAAEKREVEQTRKEAEAMFASKRKQAKKIASSSTSTSGILSCSPDSSMPSQSEYSRNIARAKGKGEGAAIGFQMGGAGSLSSTNDPHSYCIQNANASGLACPYAKVYLSSCLRNLGY